jgi:hypothetical protein
VTVGKQPVGEVRADESRAAGDQYAHGRGGGYLSSSGIGRMTSRDDRQLADFPNNASPTI